MRDEFIFYAPGNEFLLPYIEREVEKSPAPMAVMISSTDIYEPCPDSILDENAPLRNASVWAERERAFISENPDGIILRSAPIVGTGMEGAMRKLAEEIYRGRFFHFPGNETRKSVVHAVDIARAVSLFLKLVITPQQRIFNITDGVDPTLHDLAEALAYRINNKRISYVSTRPQQLFARWFYSKRYIYYTTNERFSCEALKNTIGIAPTDVCNYLRTHSYDDSSL